MPPIPMSVHLAAVLSERLWRKRIREIYAIGITWNSAKGFGKEMMKIQLEDIGKLYWLRTMVVESNQRLRHKRWYITRVARQ
nr:hypothetical protein [Tanacetum cinerariifolium]